MHFANKTSKLKRWSPYGAVGLLVFVLFQACTTQKERTFSLSDLPSEESFTVITGETNVGYLKLSRSGDTLITDYDYKNNGRGPTIADTIILNADGLPVKWDIEGSTTFGNKIDEHFKLQGKLASWVDVTGSGTATVGEPTLYIDQNGSPYSLFISTWALLNAPDSTLNALPAGKLKLTQLETFSVTSPDSTQLPLTTYAISGADMNPTYLILDDNRQYFAFIHPHFAVIRSGFEGIEKSMRQLAAKYSAERYEHLQQHYAHNYAGKVRVKNVRLFDPHTLALTGPSSVLISGDKIVSIDAADASGENETEIDGAGGTLVAGLYDMHAHMGVNESLLNVLAGVTSVRDMGNDNAVLDSLIDHIEGGVLAGPRITRMGFIEGKSPYSANNGILVESEEEALAAVTTYHEKGYYGIKLYNSMNGDWAPAIVKKAHEFGMPVMGHVPAFSNANAMLRAGFDEMTHINQVMLGWVLTPEEDTRTLLRLTAMQRFPKLDLNSPKVQETLNLMVKNKTAIDPTLAIHEALLLSRNGETWPGALDYIDHMPANVQRSYKEAMANISTAEEDTAYSQAFDQIVATLKMMKDRGILIVPGTDLGGGFNVHRELELYQQLGYTPAELLKLDSYDMANYLGQKDRGAIEPGMLADFFLIPGDPTKDLKAIKTISMVSRGGTIYYPSEVFPELGIEPFVEKPALN
ncbi:amidohydrolase family protein [Mangrovibacterium lignilyticum]|uniref:amidohydrolase family protein n=1 Tax=Mangrovibacterium lignilyticum TaxID=2668052 RepID=UPI0013D8C102|nr:amidohydrolase family protein [Mangrovibacterium lignilyticum]